MKQDYRQKGVRESLIIHILEQLKEEPDVILVARAGSDLAEFCERHGITLNTQYKFFSGRFRR